MAHFSLYGLGKYLMYVAKEKVNCEAQFSVSEEILVRVLLSNQIVPNSTRKYNVTIMFFNRIE